MKQPGTVNGRNLPFWTKETEIAELAMSGRGVIVMPTGTGKTTQAPQLLHEWGFTDTGAIWVSVPTRVLAQELASRVAEEMGVELGGLVGYQIRGETKASRATCILFMTEGVLRGKIRQNPMLDGVSVVLFDEFHKRSLLGDFNVALVERAQQEGSKVAFLLMSATVDPSQLAQHFECGVVDGADLETLHPIKVSYAEPTEGLAKSAAEEALRLAISGKGNGIVFMPGRGEIDATIAEMRKSGIPSGVTVLPLYGELPPEERHLPFVTRPGVTITVTTDIVETGATLPDVGWVVDSGLAREKSYDPVADISPLGICQIARDRLDQRKGRCGRVRPGQCVRLFSERNFLGREERTQPEILRTPLREVILTIKALGLSREGKPLRLLDSPAKANWQQAKKQLRLLGFVDESDGAFITEDGLKAVELGCDPREARMLMEAARLGCLREVAIAVASTQTRQLFYRPKEEEWKADSAHGAFKTSRICDAWTIVRAVRSAEARSGSLGAWCKDHYVSYPSLKDTLSIARQLGSAMEGLGFSSESVAENLEEALCRAICAGLPDMVYHWKGRRDWYHNPETGDEAVLGRESCVTVRSMSMPVVAWQMFEPNEGFRVISSAAVVLK